MIIGTDISTAPAANELNQLLSLIHIYWAAYTSRITACKILNDARTNKVESLYFGETETMVSDWWHLENLESNTYLKIVTGEADLDE